MTKYVHQISIGNQIKPTVVEYPREQATIDDYDSVTTLNV